MGLGFQLKWYSRIRASWRHRKGRQAAPAYSDVPVDAAFNLNPNPIGPQRRWSIWTDTLALVHAKRLHALITTARLPWSAWISENCAVHLKSVVEAYREATRILTKTGALSSGGDPNLLPFVLSL